MKKMTWPWLKTIAVLQMHKFTSESVAHLPYFLLCSLYTREPYVRNQSGFEFQIQNLLWPLFKVDPISASYLITSLCKELSFNPNSRKQIVSNDSKQKVTIIKVIFKFYVFRWKKNQRFMWSLKCLNLWEDDI